MSIAVNNYLLTNLIPMETTSKKENQMPLDIIKWTEKNAKPGHQVIPLISTEIRVKVLGGVATVATSRLFRNTDDKAIEATITFPIPTAAVLYNLQAEIDGRTLSAHAEARNTARQTYEQAIDSGKTTVLHEELLPGIHQLSVGNIPPKKDIVVTSEWVVVLQAAGKVGSDERKLWIPTTVGDIYGNSPLSEAQGLTHSEYRHTASLFVEIADIDVSWYHDERDDLSNIILDHPIVISFNGIQPAIVTGVDAYGSAVKIATVPHQSTLYTKDLTVIIDDSGSMSESVAGPYKASTTKHAVVRDALLKYRDSFQEYIASDPYLDIDVYKFADKAKYLGHLTDPFTERELLQHDGGVTAIGKSLRTILDQRRQLNKKENNNILLITDGKSYDDLPVQEFINNGYRFTVLLIGEDALDANVGYLASATGGEIFVSAEDIDEKFNLALKSALHPIYNNSSEVKTDAPPNVVRRFYGGIVIEARWSNTPHTLTPIVASEGETNRVCVKSDLKFERAIGSLAASLAVPGLTEEFATVWATDHNIVSHLTSLVLVDETGEKQKGIPTSHKIALTTPRTASFQAKRDCEASLYSFQPPERGISPKIGLTSPVEVFSDFTMKPSFRIITPFTRDLASKVEWGKYADLLSRGTMSCLPGSVMTAVVTVADIGYVSALATSLGVSAKTVAIALLALFLPETETSAHRVSRFILKDASPTLLLAARIAVGI